LGFEVPGYSITVGINGALQFFPPIDTRSLGLALSYHFPQERTMKENMQAAIEQWICQQFSTQNDVPFGKENNSGSVHDEFSKSGQTLWTEAESSIAVKPMDPEQRNPSNSESFSRPQSPSSMFESFDQP
jgi:hypothetical protein